MTRTGTPATHQRPAGSAAPIAGGLGALAACCTLQLLIFTGVLAGVSGLAIGGIAVAAGAAVAAVVWLTVLLRRRRQAAARRPTDEPSDPGRQATGPTRPDARR